MLTVFPVLYNTAFWLIYIIAGSLYFLIPLMYFASLFSPFPFGASLFSVSLLLFCCICSFILFLDSAAAANSLQSCPTLCDPIGGSPPGSPVPGILQARTLEWVAIPSPMHESENWKWSRSVMSDSEWPHGLQPTRLLRPWNFPGKSTGVGCHCLLHFRFYI